MQSSTPSTDARTRHRQPAANLSEHRECLRVVDVRSGAQTSLKANAATLAHVPQNSHHHRTARTNLTMLAGSNASQTGREELERMGRTSRQKTHPKQLTQLVEPMQKARPTRPYQTRAAWPGHAQQHHPENFLEAFHAPSNVFLCVCPGRKHFKTTWHASLTLLGRGARNLVSGSRGCCPELAAVAATSRQQITARHITYETFAFCTTTALLNARSGSISHRASKTNPNKWAGIGPAWP